MPKKSRSSRRRADSSKKQSRFFFQKAEPIPKTAGSIPNVIPNSDFPSSWDFFILTFALVNRPLTALTIKEIMVTKLLKVVAQTEPVYVPSRKAEGGQLAKSMIRLKELGGEYEDEYICAMFGNRHFCSINNIVECIII